MTSSDDLAQGPAVVELAGVVTAPPDDVWGLLVEARRQGGGGAVAVDEERHRITVEGPWWYGGRDEVIAHPRGTKVTHRVVNRATGPGRLLSELVQVRSHRRHAREEFAFLLGTIGQRLGCRTWVLRDEDQPPPT